jgi:tRNA threonylcarbamoyl adenosine modification protein YeaZ
MLSLVIESCTERSLVALIEDDICLYFAGLPFGLHNSRYLLPKIEEGFNYIAKQAQDLDCITVGIGPGSYTGMRVGATIAKSLSYASKVPLIGICSLKGFLPERNGHFSAVIDAKMGGCYILKGVRENDCIQYEKPEVCPLDQFKEKLQDIEILVGPSFDHLRKKIAQSMDDIWEWQESAPDPLQLTRLACEKYQNKDFSLDGTLQLLYLREP